VWFLIIFALAGKVLAVCTVAVAAPTAAALWFIPDALIAYHLFIPRAQGLVRSCRYFETDRREVWLTIDDGPDPDDTPRILELLKVHGAKATFFVIGRNAESHPALVRAICDAGHEIGYHTHTHPVGSFWCASPQRLARELDQGLAVLNKLGVTVRRFRSPVGIKNLWLAPALSKRCLECVGWSGRGLELTGGDDNTVAKRVLCGLRPGSILLLHEGPPLPAPLRVNAIQRTLERLKEEGYKCVVPDKQCSSNRTRAGQFPGHDSSSNIE
jgi:peptidoglycan/xylan/chitin deacetylase (PgdA/CDA1 family)